MVNVVGQARELAVTGARRTAKVKAILAQSYLLIVLIAICLVGVAVSPEYFLTVRNLANVVSVAAIYILLALGQFFVVLTGGIDLSAGSILALSTVLSAITLRAELGAGTATTLTLAGCALAGALNGLLIVWLKLPPFIATLATMSSIKGASYIIQSTELIQIRDAGFIEAFATGSIMGIRTPILLAGLATVVVALVARYTTFGRGLYAIGGNTEAARLSGLPVSRNLLITYTVSGVLAGLAGVMAAAQLRQGSSLIGVGYELDAIAAVVIGGASLAGGKGSPLNAVIGVFVLTLIINIMNLVGISSEPQLVIKGLVIVVAVFLSSAGGVKRISDWLRRARSGR